jgi:ethanolamine utilization protein EutN
MELARVLGNVVATRKVEGLEGVRLLWIQPEDERGEPRGQPLVAADPTRAGPGQRVFFVRAREAAEALEERFVPVDAAIVGHVHHLDLAGRAPSRGPA